MFSLRSAKSRLDGDWNVTSYTENGVNAMSTTDPQSDVCWSGDTKTWNNTLSSTMTMSFDKGGTVVMNQTTTGNQGVLNYVDCSVDYTPVAESYSLPGNWTFGDKKKSITISSLGGTQNFDIVRLTNKEMKLKGIVNGDIVEMTLESK